MEFIPPQDIEMEKALLGACLISKESIKEVISTLLPENFYSSAHILIYSAITDMYAQGQPADVLTVTSYLREKKQLEQAGGVSYLMHLGDALPSTTNSAYYGKQIKKKALLRSVQLGSYEVFQQSGKSSDPEEVISILSGLLYNLNTELIKDSNSDLYRISEALNPIYEEILNSPHGLAEKHCIKTGYPQLDKMALLQNSYLIYLAGRPSSGKTTFAFNMALHLVLRGYPVYFGSYEVAKRFSMVRILCQAGNIANEKIMFGSGEAIRESLAVAVNKLHSAPFYLSHKAVSVERIGRMIEVIRDRESKTPIVFLDRFEFIDEPYIAQDGNEQSRLSRVSRKLKDLKDEYDTPVICLIQMNREIEKRSSKMPVLSDLQGTGATEQNAQAVIIVHRDKELNMSQKKQGLTQTADLVIAKNQNGACGKVPFRFESEIPSFFELADIEEQREHSNYHEAAESEDLPF